MSLDQNLFTLLITPSKDDPNVIDLADNSPSPVIHYRKRRLPGPTYKIEVYDPLSDSLLITATAPSATAKQKTLELCNPTTIVELKYSGTISFKWSFKWEQHEFEWKREECYLLRKPDPPVLVAVTKVTQGRYKTSSVQILDYNINRFDIDDRKGLEIVMLTALLTFQDLNDQHHSPREELPPPPVQANLDAPKPARSSARSSRSPSPSVGGAPKPPPKPAPRTGVDRIAEMQMSRGEYNEITVENEGNVHDYAQYCWNLLQDDALLFITLRSDTAEQVPKVIQVVEETKRIRYKAGTSEEEELHQYVLYDTAVVRKGPRRINLDSDETKSKTDYTPPTSLTIHLSKIPMPELQPKSSAHDKPSKEPKKADDKHKGHKGKKKEERKVVADPPRQTRPRTASPTRLHQRPPIPDSPPQLAQQNELGAYNPPSARQSPRHTRSSSYSKSSASQSYAYPPSDPPPSLYGPYAPYQPGPARGRDPSPYRPAANQQRPSSGPSQSMVNSIWEILHRR